MADSLHCLGIDTSSSPLFHHDSRNPSVVPVDKLDPITHQHVVKAADALEQEFEGLYTREQIELVMDESIRQLAEGNVAEFVPVLAHRFARERLRARARASGRLAKDVPVVLFVGLQDSGRGQMGAALLAHHAKGRVAVQSARSGTRAAIDPAVAEALRELGLDLAEAYSKPLTADVLTSADIVVTMGRSVGDVEVPDGTCHEDWRVGDPNGANLDEVRRIRDDIDRRVQRLLDELDG